MYIFLLNFHGQDQEGENLAFPGGGAFELFCGLPKYMRKTMVEINSQNIL